MEYDKCVKCMKKFFDVGWHYSEKCKRAEGHKCISKKEKVKSKMEPPIVRSPIWPSLLVAIPCTCGAIMCAAILVVAIVQRNVVMAVVEGFICYCFASSAVYYWHRYFLHRRMARQRKKIYE